MQAEGANSIELTGTPVTAPLEAAWESIRTGLRRDLGARTFDAYCTDADFDDDGRNVFTLYRYHHSCAVQRFHAETARTALPRYPDTVEQPLVLRPRGTAAFSSDLLAAARNACVTELVAVHPVQVQAQQSCWLAQQERA